MITRNMIMPGPGGQPAGQRIASPTMDKITEVKDSKEEAASAGKSAGGKTAAKPGFMGFMTKKVMGVPVWGIAIGAAALIGIGVAMMHHGKPAPVKA